MEGAEEEGWGRRLTREIGGGVGKVGYLSRGVVGEG
jgi:hypothetical protein